MGPNCAADNESSCFSWCPPLLATNLQSRSKPDADACSTHLLFDRGSRRRVSWFNNGCVTPIGAMAAANACIKPGSLAARFLGSGAAGTVGATPRFRFRVGGNDERGLGSRSDDPDPRRRVQLKFMKGTFAGRAAATYRGASRKSIPTTLGTRD